MRRISKEPSRIVRSTKADRIVETYRELGFVPEEEGTRGTCAQDTGAWLAPMSFQPHIDYTVSSFVGGF